MDDDSRVETSTMLWGELVDAVDKDRQRDNELKPIVWEFTGNHFFRDGNGFYTG